MLLISVAVVFPALSVVAVAVQPGSAEMIFRRILVARLPGLMHAANPKQMLRTCAVGSTCSLYTKNSCPILLMNPISK